jgi:serine/threonine protein kinase
MNANGTKSLALSKSINIRVSPDLSGASFFDSERAILWKNLTTLCNLLDPCMTSNKLVKGFLGSQREDAMILEIGQHFDGRFCVERLLGSGGGGTVYLVIDQRREERFALKIPLPFHPSMTHENFMLWAGLRRSLRSPHTVRFVTTHGHWPRPYWVMEYVAGATLDDVLRRHGPLSSARARRLLLEVLDALAEAHGVGLIHRDVRPANIVISGRDQAKVLDFERAMIVRREGASYEASAADDLPRLPVGPRFAAPEDIDSGPVDSAADIYSVGLVAWQMLTGLTPFAGLSSSALLYEKFSKSPHPLPLDALGPEWSQLIERACAKMPAQRYSTAELMIEALEGVPD